MKKIDVDTWSRRSVLGAFAAATAATSALVPQTVLPADAAKPSVASSAARPSRKTPIVSTTAGKVRGYQDQSVFAFKGIRYGQAPVGAGRFKRAEKPTPWTGLYDATDYGPAAPQLPRVDMMPFEETKKSTAVLHSVFGVTTFVADQSEDCLVLNVWTPALDGQKRPVMFRIHGGGFFVGSGNWSWHDGTNLALRGDVVVVTVNHRLNFPGYLYLGGLSQEYSEGNAGMMDLVLALEWVRDNIAAFGGDPANVMIFGESGGGAKVSTLLAMPAAKGLFHRAAIQSGAMLNCISAEQATEQAKAVLSYLKIASSDLSKLRDLPLKSLFDAQMNTGAGSTAAFAIAPVVDGVTLLKQPGAAIDAGASADVPLLIGTTLTEGTLLRFSDPASAAQLGRIMTLDDASLQAVVRRNLGDKGEAILAQYRQMAPQATPAELLLRIESGAGFRRSSIEFAERRIAAGRAPVYMYLLEWKSAAYNGWVLASHGMCVPLTMDNVQVSGAWTADYPEAQIVADQMSEAWIAFARSGNPEHNGIPKWPAYDTTRRATMSFDVKSQVKNDPYREAILWKDAPSQLAIRFEV